MSDGGSPVARALLVIVLVVGVLGFGAVGLCGGIFTFWLITDPGAARLLLLSLPCLLGGLFMAWICVRKIARMAGEPPQPDDAA